MQKNTPSRSGRSAAAFETLETRQLMSVTLGADQTVYIKGTGGNDVIQVSRDQATGKIKVNDNGVNHLFSPASVKFLYIEGLGGHDTLRSSDAVTKPTTIFGGDGNDKIRGGGGIDYLDGGIGDDTLDGGKASDVMYGRAGTDTVDYSTRTTPVGVTLDDKANDGAGDDLDSQADNYWYYGFTSGPYAYEEDNAHSDIENVLGGAKDDWIRGDIDANDIHGNGGGDYIEGLGGSDTLYGDAGSDGIFGSSLYTDMLDADETHEYGTDKLYGGANGDFLNGNRNGHNDLYGESGEDDLRGGGLSDNLYGGDQNDYMEGWGGNDFMSGGNGNDTLRGGSGADELFGGPGADTVTWQYDVFGTDAEVNVGVTVTLDDIANDGFFTYSSESDNAHSDIENIIGSKNADTLIGNSGNNVLMGNSGDDSLYGNGGIDTLNGGEGNDKLYAKDGLFGDIVIGGPGSDTAWIDYVNVGLKDTLTEIEVIK